jgi:PD-(D/E)XK nuclease superfamily protein
MVAVGWLIDGQRYTFDEAYQQARQAGHLDGFVPAALRAMEKNNERVDGHWLSPSAAGGCPRQRILLQTEPEFLRPEKKWKPFTGVALHNQMHDAADEFQEHWLTVPLQVPLRDGTMYDFTLQGTTDSYDPEFFRITDYKTVEDFRKKYPYDSHVTQVQLYRLMFEMNGYKVNELMIWYVRQGGDAKRQVINVPLWHIEDTYAIALELAEPLAWAAKTGSTLPEYRYNPREFIPCTWCPVVEACKRER